MAGYVKVRLPGILPGVSAAARALTATAESEGFVVAEVSQPYPNRRDPGFRLYVTLRFPADNETALKPRGATHRRQAIRRPAAPTRRHLP